MLLYASVVKQVNLLVHVAEEFISHNYSVIIHATLFNH